VVQEDPCWACHWQRVFGLPAAVVPLGTVSPSRALALLPPRAAISVARFTRLSRGPPSVL
jgi:hypothetical protein